VDVAPMAIGGERGRRTGLPWLSFENGRARLKTANGFGWRPLPRDPLLPIPPKPADFRCKTQQVDRPLAIADRHQPRPGPTNCQLRSPPRECLHLPDRARDSKAHPPTLLTHLVMHGSQPSVPRKMAGHESTSSVAPIPKPMGVPVEEESKRPIRNVVVRAKINIDTDNTPGLQPPSPVREAAPRIRHLPTPRHFNKAGPGPTESKGPCLDRTSSSGAHGPQASQ